LRVANFFTRTSPNTILLESSGPPYQGFATISVLAGRRTILGELDKLVSHGVSTEEIHKRQVDIVKLYSAAPDAAEVAEKYGIEYIVLGPAEHRAYPGIQRNLP